MRMRTEVPTLHASTGRVPEPRRWGSRRGPARPLVAYGVAVLASVAALLVRFGLTAWVGPGLPTYITFYPAVMLIAMLYGLGPGVLTTMAAAVFATAIIVPRQGIAVESAVDLVGLGLFTGMGCCMAVIAERYRRTWQRALRTAEALAMRSEQLRLLTGELTLAEERERQRLRDVLHDGLQQLLVAVRIRLASGNRPEARTGETGHDLQALVDEAIGLSRSLALELSPPVLHSAGFVPAVAWLAEWFLQTHHLTVTLTADPSVQVASEPTKILLFQSVRELLFNVVKHADVRQAAVEIAQRGPAVEIVVADQGQGFTPPPFDGGTGRGLGLAVIRQRLEFLNGQFTVTSAPGQGSRFTLRVPVVPLSS